MVDFSYILYFLEFSSLVEGSRPIKMRKYVISVHFVSFSVLFSTVVSG